MNEQINQSDVFVIFRNTEINFDDYKITPLVRIIAYWVL